MAASRTLTHRLKAGGASLQPLLLAVRGVLAAVGVDAIPRTVHGQRVRLPLSGHSLSSLLFDRSYLADFEPEFLLAVRERVRPGDVVFDIGGYKGLYTYFFARDVGETGRVVTFEPHPGHLRVLSDLVRSNRLANVTLAAAAVGRSVGEVRFSLDGAGSHIEAEAGGMAVEATTLDHYVASSGLTPDVVKVDVEGFEVDVLEAGAHALSRVRVVCCEVHPAKIAAFGRTPEEVFQLLRAYGFEQTFQYLPLKHRQDPGRPFNVIFERL